LGSELSDVVAKIVLTNILMGEAVGYGAEKSDQYKSFQRLKAIATSEELIKFAKHPNGVVGARKETL